MEYKKGKENLVADALSRKVETSGTVVDFHTEDPLVDGGFGDSPADGVLEDFPADGGLGDSPADGILCLRADVKRHVQECETWQRLKHETCCLASLLQPLPILGSRLHSTFHDSRPKLG